MAIGSPPPDQDDDFIRLDDDDEPNPVQCPTNATASPIRASAPTESVVQSAEDGDITFGDITFPDESEDEPHAQSVLPNKHEPESTRAPKQKSPKGIRGIIHNKTARLFVWGTLVGGAVGGAIYVANKIPFINGSSNIPDQTQPATAKAPAEAPAKVPAKVPAKIPAKTPAEIPAGTIIVPESIDEAKKNNQIIVTPAGKKKPAIGWKWTYPGASPFKSGDMREFSVTKE